MNPALGVRPSPIAGQWYLADPHRLAEQVDAYLSSARLPEVPGQVIGIVAPHAGHRYSGPVAAHAFAAVRSMSPEVVAVVAPMHYPYPDPLLTSAHFAYATPLGHVPVDREGLELLDGVLQELLGCGLTPLARDPEHSLEIELPFLQRALGRPFRLLPIMVRDQSAAVMRSLGQSLAHALRGRPALLVASSDLSHFYPQPVANRFDEEFLRRVEAFDPAGVLSAEEEGRAFACGRGPVAAVLWAAENLGANQVQILHYTTSGEVTGDYDQVVGYGAAVIYRSTAEG